MVNTTPYVSKKPKVNLANFFSIKKILDEELMEFIAVNGYKEMHLFTDARNIIIVLSILCGCLAQFFFKFPENTWGIFGCIVGYAFFTLLAQCIEWFGMNGNTHIIVIDEQVKDNDKITKLHQNYSIGIKSELKTYSSDWNVSFTSRVSSKCTYTAVIDIRQIFDVNGEFVKKNYDRALVKEWANMLKAFNTKSE